MTLYLPIVHITNILPSFQRLGPCNLHPGLLINQSPRMHSLINRTKSSENNESEHCILAIPQPNGFMFTDRSSSRQFVLEVSWLQTSICQKYADCIDAEDAIFQQVLPYILPACVFG